MNVVNLDENGEMITPINYKLKYEEIIKALREEFFNNISERDTYDITYDSNGNEKKKKKTAKKNEVMPFLSVLQVNSKLNELLRVYKPMSEREAFEQDDVEYLEALKWYMALITDINKYISLIPSKQSFSAFANITTAIYNELMVDPNFSQVFGSIEDYLIDFNYTAGVSSLVDAKMVQNRLQTKDAGHNLVKPLESITLIQNNKVDFNSINEKLAQFEGMAGIKSLPNKK